MLLIVADPASSLVVKQDIRSGLLNGNHDESAEFKVYALAKLGVLSTDSAIGVCLQVAYPTLGSLAIAPRMKNYFNHDKKPVIIYGPFSNTGGDSSSTSSYAIRNVRDPQAACV